MFSSFFETTAPVTYFISTKNIFHSPQSYTDRGFQTVRMMYEVCNSLWQLEKLVIISAARGGTLLTRDGILSHYISIQV